MIRRIANMADRVALRKIVKKLPEPLGRAADAIGGSATHGKLWIACAGLLMATGARGRRAAASGLSAWMATTALINGPVKWMTRRHRPTGLALADLPRRDTPPDTSSFPSSHTASATAFVVAASFEAPAVAPVLAVAAGAVALQRLRAVRHYPTDVLGGICIGFATGATTTAVAHGLRRRAQRRVAPHMNAAENPDGSAPGSSS